MYIFSNGKEYTEDQVAEAARRSNMSIEAYIAKAGLKLSTDQEEPTAKKKLAPKKQTPAVQQETTTAEEPKSMVSKSATTSSVSKKKLWKDEIQPRTQVDETFIPKPKILKEKPVNKPSIKEKVEEGKQIMQKGREKTKPMRELKAKISLPSEEDILDISTNVQGNDYDKLAPEEKLYVDDKAVNILQKAYGKDAQYDLSPSEIELKSREILSKAKQTKKEIAEESYASKLLNVDLLKGLNYLGEAFASVPETIYTIGAIPQNIYAAISGDKNWEASPEKFKKTFGVENPIMDKFITEQERLGSMQTIYNNANYDSTSIIENISEGNYVDAFKLMGSGLAESAPISIAMMAGGAELKLGELAAGSTLALAGPNIRQQEEENPEQSELASVVKGFGMAGAESVFSAIGEGSLGKVYKDIVKKEGIEAGSKIFKDGLITMYQSALKKFGAPAAMLGEGLEEVATTITQNMINNKNPFEGALDSFVLGVGGGGLYGSPLTIAKGISGFKDGITIHKINKQLKTENIDNLVTAFKPEFQSSPAKIKTAFIPGASKILDNQVETAINNGEMTKEDGDKIRLNFRQTQGIVNSLQPLKLSDDNLAPMVDLLKEKKQLEEVVKQVGDPNITTIQGDRIKEINKELTQIAKADIQKKVEADVEKTKTAIEEIGLGETTELVEINNEQELTDYLSKNTKFTQEQIEAKTGTYGFFIPLADGKEALVINKPAASVDEVITTGQHEFLHKVLYKAVSENKELQKKIGTQLYGHIESSLGTDALEYTEFQERYLGYKEEFEQTKTILEKKVAKAKEFLDKGVITQELYNEKVAEADAKIAQQEGDYLEEVLTLLSESLSKGDIQYNETFFTKIGDIIRQILQKYGLKQIEFKTGKDVFNFVRDYNKSFEKGKFGKSIKKLAKEGKYAGSTVEAGPTIAVSGAMKESKNIQEKMDKLDSMLDNGEIDYDDYEIRMDALVVEEAKALKAEKAKKAAETKPIEPKQVVKKELSLEDEVKEIIANNKATIASDKVQQIYDKKGVNGAQDIINLFKPITAKIVDKRRDAPGFDRELLTDEIETGVSGILDMITKYDPKSKVPLAAYINKYLPVRAIAASKRVLDKSFSKDIEDQKGLMATETAEQTVTTQLPEKPKYTNILEAKMFEDEVINSIINKALTVLRTLKTKINEPVSKNVTATPLVREIREEMGTQADIDIKRALGGKEGGVLKRNLLTNKKVILENMTTTWLMGKDTKNGVMGGVPPAVQKQVDGKWLSYPDWVGKTPDREKTTTDLAGRTSGADMVRRLPNAANNISNEEFLSWFLEPSGNPIRGRKESLSKALAEEISFDIIAADFANEGPLFEAFSSNQERLGAEMEKVVAVEFNRQAERGNVKFSSKIKNPNKVSYSALKVLEKNNWDLESQGYSEFLNKLTTDEQAYLKDILGYKLVDDLMRQLKTIQDNIAWVNYEKDVIQKLNDYLNQSDDYKDIKVISTGNAGPDSKKVDLEIKVNDSMFNIELKLNKNAQIGSVTIQNIADIANGKANTSNVTNLPLSSGISKKIAEELNSKSADIKEYVDFLLENGGIVLSSGNIRVPFSAYTKAKALKLQRKATVSIKGFFDEQLINDLNVKGNDAIGFKDQGLFALTGSKLKGLLPEFKGSVDFTMRIVKGSLDADNNVTVYFRGFPKMNASWDGKSEVEIKGDPKPLLDVLEMTKIYNDIQRQNNIAEASIKASRPASSKDIKKIRVFDFDDTLARTKSNVLYTTPSDFIAYHGAPLGKDFKKPSSKGVTFFATDKREADEYARMRDGETQKVILDTKGMINEDQALNKINELGLKPKDPDWTIEEQSFYELIDTRFEGALSQNDINKLFKELAKDGIKSIAYIDGAQVSGKTTRSIAVLDNSVINEQRKIDAAEFAKNGSQLLSDGAEFDFSEFSKVVEGKKGPLFEVAKIINEKTEGDVFVLTARPENAALPIHEFLKELGLNIPLKNIIGLGNSSPQAKADWIVSKVADGYNDFYFADDHTGNIKAVKDALNVFDVKSKVQQARIKESMAVGKRFNNIIAKNKRVSPAIEYSGITAKRLGAKKGKYKFFLPAGAEDFEGLLYSFIGKGKTGEEQAKFFEETLINPYWDGVAAIESARQRIKKDFIALKQAFPEAAKKITKRTPDGNFTYDQAVRVYLWNKEGVKIPDLSKTDQKQLSKIVQNDPQLFAFANGLELISGRDGKWSEPSEFWDSETIVSELNNMTEKIGRKKYLEQFIENADEIFTNENLNKIEALYGAGFRDALEDSLYRMKNGKNRSQGAGKFTSAVSTWVNGSVAEIMFLNTKSGVLQLISALNYLNLNDNNPIMAGKALLDFPQFTKDFAMIFNSDMMKERRQGLKEDVSAAEIANAAATAKNKVKALVAYLAKIGFTPTTIADALSIGIGGATFYRNRVNSYAKKGLDIKEAEAKAWKDFTRLTNKSAQSNDPALISQQQAEPIGRLILSFGNATMQMNRIMKKSAKDLINGRGNPAEHVSRILFYGFIQNALFSALQKALFIGLFGTPDDEEDKKKVKTTEEKAFELADDMLDSFLRGSGLAGAAVSTAKNTAQQYFKQRDKGAKGDQAYTLLEGLNISPSIGSKARKVYSAIQEEKYNREVIKRMGGDIVLEGKFNPSPVYTVGAKVTAATTNLPADRVLDKINNINEALDARNENWQRTMLLLGYKPFELGVKNEEQEFLKRLGTADFTARELRELPIEKREQVREARRENKKEKIEKLKEKRAEKRAERREKRRRLYE